MCAMCREVELGALRLDADFTVDVTLGVYCVGVACFCGMQESFSTGYIF